MFERTLGAPARDDFGSLAAREKLGSTGSGKASRFRMAASRGSQGPRRVHSARHADRVRRAGRQTGRPTFRIARPEHATEEHLQLLSELAQMFSDRSFRDRLAVTANANDLLDLFRAWKAA
jgi:PTS system nitrogen regulatory IIA component